jgi:hypothetical protein
MLVWLKTLKEAHNTYIPAAGLLNVWAVPTPYQAVIFILQKWHVKAAALTPGACGQALFKELASTYKQIRYKKFQS